jgi:hypothetical protein
MKEHPWVGWRSMLGFGVEGGAASACLSCQDLLLPLLL